MSFVPKMNNCVFILRYLNSCFLMKICVRGVLRVSNYLYKNGLTCLLNYSQVTKAI